MELSVIPVLSVYNIFAVSAIMLGMNKAVGAANVKKNTARTVLQTTDVGVALGNTARNVKK